MKITITADGGSPVTLCDHGREGPSGFTVTPLRNIEVHQFVQAEYARPVDRGNVLTQITFNVSREHASVADAEKYCITINSIIPRSGQVVFELSDQETFLVGHKSTCEVGCLPPIGVLTTTAYTIKTGMIDTAVQVLTQSGGELLTASGGKIYVNQGV